MPTNTEHTPQPRGSAPRPWNVAHSLAICSGCGKACGMPQHTLSKAPLKKKTCLDTHTHRCRKVSSPGTINGWINPVSRETSSDPPATSPLVDWMKACCVVTKDSLEAVWFTHNIFQTENHCHTHTVSTHLFSTCKWKIEKFEISEWGATKRIFLIF